MKKEKTKFRVNNRMSFLQINENEYMIKSGSFSQTSMMMSDEEETGLLSEFFEYFKENPVFTLEKIQKDKPIDNLEDILMGFVESGILYKGNDYKNLKVLIATDYAESLVAQIFDDLNVTIDTCKIEDYKKYLTKSYDFLMIVAEKYKPRLFHEINGWAIKNHVELQISFLDNTALYVLPKFSLNETVCYSEVEMQLEASMKNFSQMITYKDYVMSGGEVPSSPKGYRVLHLGFICAELYNGEKIGYEQNVLKYVDLSTMNVEKVKVLRQPYCTACNQDEVYTHLFL